jgi:menaquinone-dependent protoporphyrinogen oxidase
VTNLLLVYHSYDGQTAKVADHLARGLRAHGLDVDLRDVAHAPGADGYDGVVVGDAIRFGRHSRALVRYLRAQAAKLAGRPLVVFQVSMTAATQDDEHRKVAAGFTRSLERRTGVHPALVVDVAGALPYTSYGFVTKRVMRSIARREGNATDTTRDHEYTDWTVVDGLADRIATTMARAAP